jgi:hypothetical protein
MFVAEASSRIRKRGRLVRVLGAKVGVVVLQRRDRFGYREDGRMPGPLVVLWGFAGGLVESVDDGSRIQFIYTPRDDLEVPASYKGIERDPGV